MPITNETATSYHIYYVHYVHYVDRQRVDCLRALHIHR